MSYKYCPHCGGRLPQDPGHKEPSANRPSYVDTNAVPEPISAEKTGEIIGPARYDQTRTWRYLMERVADLRANHDRDIAIPLMEGGGKTVVHLVFDEIVCPRGGLMNSLISTLSATQPPTTPRLKPRELEAMGYMIDSDGKIQTVNDIPVGRIYGVLQYWGGYKQHKRWHMSKPIELDPSKKGDPAFMDERMVAFVAHWEDADKMVESINELEDVLAKGVQGLNPVGRPRLIELVWVK